MAKNKLKNVIDWMWDYFDFRYCPAYWTKPQRLLRKTDLTEQDARMYEQYYDEIQKK